MKNPCLNCEIHLSGTDKKNHERCRECSDRTAYVASMGSMTHSLPDRHCDLTHRDPVRPRLKDKGVGMETKKRFCTGGCLRRLELNGDNFGRSAKTADGFMKICKQCHSRKIAEGKERRLKTGRKINASSESSKAKASPPPTKPKVYKISESKKPLCLTVDFSNHPKLLSSLQKAASEQMRTPEMQLLYLVKIASLVDDQDQKIPF